MGAKKKKKNIVPHLMQIHVQIISNHYTLSHQQKKEYAYGALFATKNRCELLIQAFHPHKEISFHPKPLQCIKINLTLLNGF